jgi:hypothetical protein
MRVNVFVGTMKGAFLLRSDAGRRKWTVEGPLFKGWKVTAASTRPGGGWLAATASDVYGAQVHRSDDLTDWTPIEKGPAFPEGSAFQMNQIWTLCHAGERLYAGVDEAALFQSDDRGRNWRLVEALSGHPTRRRWFPGFGGLCNHAVLVDPRNPGRIWCGISAVGVFRSEDGGASWRPRNDGLTMVIEDRDHKDIGYCVHALVADPSDPDTIYQQNHRGMFRTRDGAASWQPIQNGLPSTFGFPLVLDRATGTLFCVPLESDEYRFAPGGTLHVYRSHDGGDSWRAGHSLSGHHAYTGVLRSALAVDHLDPCGVYLGTTSGDVHVSADGGETWQALPVSLPRVLTVEAFVEG